MKLYDASVLIFLAIVITACAVGLFSSKYLGDDNPIEQAAEEIIKEETGIKIDLTPNSKEK